MDLKTRLNDFGRRGSKRRNYQSRLFSEKLEDRRLLAGESVWMSEFMASNSDTLRDDFREYSDWIEIHNPSSDPVSLGGWYLTDKEDDLAKWQLPDVTIEGNGYLVVFASGHDAANPEDELHTNFKLSSNGEYLALVRPDSTVAHAYSPEFPEQSSDVSYGIVYSEDGARFGDFGFFQEPTPGEANSMEGVKGIASDVTFSVERGFYNEAFDVALSSNAAETIRYTIDGSTPTAEHGEVFSGPITIDTTTTLRAVSYADDLLSSDSATQTYIFLNDVLQQDGEGMPELWGFFDDQGNVRQRGTGNYDVDPDIVTDDRYKDTIQDDLRSIPSISIVLDPDDLWDLETGIYMNPMSKGDQWERPVSIEWIDIDGETDLQANAGVRIHGGWARRISQTKKFSFRVNFKSEYGDPLFEYPLFGEDGQEVFQSIILRGGFNDSWRSAGNTNNTYMQDQWTRLTQLEMGGYASRHTYAHLYLNGMYWGMYSPTERMNAEWASAYMGGTSDEWDVINTGGNVVDGDTREWSRLMRATSRNVDYEEVKQLVDIEGFIDYMIVNQYIGNWDWPHNNWYASRRRAEGEKWRFHSWDAEAAFQRGISENRITGEIRQAVGPSQVYLAIREHPEFKRLFADHIQKHMFNGGVLTGDANIERLNSIAAEIDRAIVGESARWGDGKDDQGRPITRESWVRRVESINQTHLPDNRRGERVLDQYRDAGLYPSIDAPQFNQFGGHVTPDFNIEITTEILDGEIYYTTDGSSPRGADGAPSATAQRLNSVDLVGGEHAARVLIPSGAASEQDWQSPGYDDSVWSEGVATIGYDTGVVEDPLSVPGGFTVTEYQSEVRLETLADVDLLLAGENIRSETTIEGVPFIDYLNGRRGGHFEINRPFPEGARDHALNITGKLQVNKAGQYTLGATVNDAVRIVVDGNVLVDDPDRHSTEDRFVTVDLTEGLHDVQVVMFNRSGTGVIEFFYSPGEKTEFDDTFVLIGDTKHRSYEERIRSDLQDQMENINASAYVRIPFEASDLDNVAGLFLKQQYDDGYVAYLNGTEIARRNAPEALQFDSAALATRLDSNAIVPELVDVTEFKNLLNDGSNVLAIHALNADASDNDMLMSPQLIKILQFAPITLDQSATIKAAVAVNGEWSATVEADFTTAVPATTENLRISEVHYHPRAATEAEVQAGFDDEDDFEFIEIMNIGQESIDLSNVEFVKTNVGDEDHGVAFRFRDSDVNELPPGGFAVVVEDAAAFQYRYGEGVPVAGQWNGGLNNSTDTITLKIGEQTLHQFSYADTWFQETDGLGPSLEVIDPVSTAPDRYGNSTSWRAGIIDGTPGRGSGEVALAGDSNRDGVFDSSDMVLVFRAGEYEDDIAGNSTWEEGDWNLDGDFDSSDLVFAFRSGNYVAGANTNANDIAAAIDLLLAEDDDG